MNTLLSKLKGTGVALITPFKSDFSIDYDSIKKVVDHVISGGANYLVVHGTTGETSTLTEYEKVETRKCFLKANDNRLPIIIGMGSNSTNSLINYISESNLNGFSAILSVVPYYNRPSQDGLFQHFSNVANASPLPIILYNVPSRTSCNMDPTTTLRLSKNKNIIGIKEANPDITQISFLINNTNEDFLIISGDDESAHKSVLSGADGVISVAANAFPNLFSKKINSALNGNSKKTNEFFEKINPFIKLIYEEGNPTGIKSAMFELGLCENILRLPLVSSSNDLSFNIKNFISNS